MSAHFEAGRQAFMDREHYLTGGGGRLYGDLEDWCDGYLTEASACGLSRAEIERIAGIDLELNPNPEA